MSAVTQPQYELPEELNLNRSDTSMVTIPAQMFDRMASIYYLWRAGVLLDPRQDLGPGSEPSPIDEPAADATDEEGQDISVQVQGPRAGVSPQFEATSQADLDTESNDAKPTDGQPDPSEER